MSPSEPKNSPFFYYLTRMIITAFVKTWLRFSSYGSDNVPRTGGCLLASNHASYLDPSLIGAGVPHRLVRFLARDTLFRVPWFARMLYWIGVVPLSRERGDVGALKKAIQLLKGGACVCVYPEGTRTMDGELQPAKGGIGFLIAKANVMVVPIYIDGSYRAYPRGGKWIRPARCRIFCGKPIQPAEFAAFGSNREAYDKIGALVMDRIRALKPAKQLSF